MSEQKYRQRGYKESSWDNSKGSSPFDNRPGRLEGAPRGRGAERNRAEVFRCKTCGEISPAEFDAMATCPKCKGALHACVQCRYFDSSARFQCRQTIPAPVSSKSLRNECSSFAPVTMLDLTGRRASETPDQARSAFDSLFKK